MEPRTAGNSRGRRSQEDILDAASRLFAERGYAGTSIAALSSSTGLPKSAIYHHFHSKGGLLSAVMARGLNDFFGAMAAAHAEPPEPAGHAERMHWYLDRTSEVFLARAEFLRLHMILLLSAEAADVEVADTIADVRRDGRVYMNHMIRESFRDEGPEIAQAIADQLDYFGIAGFDGAFIAAQADRSRDLVAANRQLADAMVLLGEGIAARLRR